MDGDSELTTPELLLKVEVLKGMLEFGTDIINDLLDEKRSRRPDFKKIAKDYLGIVAETLQ